LHASCVVCRRELPWRERIASCCGSCWDSLPRIHSTQCRSCALPLPEGELCLNCARDPIPVAWTSAWGHYRGSLERLLHAFKFQRHDFFDAPLAELLHESLRDSDFDVIVPVPMHRSKLRRRGYNQAELLARALARRVRVQCEPLLATRVARKTQSLLGRGERRANVHDAFLASRRVAGRSVLIVDDVCTTGQTIRACADALLAAKAARVCAVAVAKAS